jgi:hypothetical protein
MRLTVKVTKGDIETAINMGVPPLEVAICDVLNDHIRHKVEGGSLILSYYQMDLAAPHIVPLTATAAGPALLESGKPRSPFKVQLIIPATVLSYDTRMAVNKLKKEKRHATHVPA